MPKGLEGLSVVSFESRLSKTMGDLIRLQGGNPVLAPSMKEVPIENNPEALTFGAKLLQGEIDVLILLTGVGTRALLSVLETKYPREAILEAFKKTVLVPRGPKPIRVLDELKIPYGVKVPEPNTWKEILEALDRHRTEIPIENKRVAVQEYGVTNPDLLHGLEERKALVIRVPVYRWALPDDLKPLESAIKIITDGKADIILFTTAVQIEHVIKVASGMGLKERILSTFSHIAVGSIGPDCSESLRQNGVAVDFEPTSTKMGPFVSEIAASAKTLLEKKRGNR